MANRVIKKPVAVAIGAALISSIAVVGVAQASAYGISALDAGCMLAGDDSPAATPATPAPPVTPADDKAKEAKCGGDKKPEEEKPAEEKPKT